MKQVKSSEETYLGHVIVANEYEIVEDGKTKMTYAVFIKDFNGCESFSVVDDGGIKIGNIRQAINATKRLMDDTLRLQEAEELYYNNFDIDKYVETYKEKANVKYLSKLLEEKKSKRILLEKVRFLKEADLI